MDHQTPDEMLAHLEGPVAAVWAWLAALTEDDWARAWRLSDDTFRLVRAQAWLWNNRDDPRVAGQDLDELAAALARPNPSHDLWPAFAELEVRAHREAWDRWNLHNMGAGTHPRPVGLDYEVVVLLEAEEPILFTETTLVPDALLFLVHLVDNRWLVANAGSDRHLVPGWPPEIS